MGSKFKAFRRKSMKQEGATRTIFVNRERPEGLEEPVSMPNYRDNRLKTAQYTVITFLPKNLFQQFRRVANFYFLCVAIIQLSIESPVSPMTSILPLVFVITVTAVKQGYEDWLRHREDNKVNNAPARVIRDGKVMDIKTRDILVGDIVEVAAEEQFPCDLLLLMSSDPEAKCEVTTANLDGETNLKTFVCPPEVHHLTSIEQLWQIRAVIECQLPHANLYDFKGRLTLYEKTGDVDTASNHSNNSGYDSINERSISNSKQMALGTENMLLRGARLKNTTLIHGVAVYTGEDTKMALNSKLTNSKFSTVEKSMNYFLVFYLVVLILEVVVSSVLKYQLYDFEMMTEEMWYLGVNQTEASGRDVAQDSFSFLVIYNYIIPISLYVTLEMQKFLGAMFMEWDDQMKCEATGERCKCNTSDLNEELGQVQYLFTDKTGTLTENTMNFRQCSVAGVRYVEEEGELRAFNNSATKTHPLLAWPIELEDFLVTLALCHTVQVSLDVKATTEVQMTQDGMALADLGIQYQAASPDEKALVEACARYGVVFEGQYKDQLTVRVQGNTRKYTRLQVIEFDSDRKCMSVVVREEATGRLWLLTKGAESSVLQRCRQGDPDHQRLRQTTVEHIDDYAMPTAPRKGRTRVPPHGEVRRNMRRLGSRVDAADVQSRVQSATTSGSADAGGGAEELNEDQYTEFAKHLNTAKQVVDDREAVVREVTDKMESELTLLGATGVEDLLQDGVQETLENLRAAGIKVWVLTGDKVETAVNIAYSCGHFKRFMTVLSITGVKDAENALTCIQACLEESEADGHYGLVVDGVALQVALDSHKALFYTLSSRCTAVVCCRMSPRQKAETVRLVKTSKESPVCAAIGDGANDVSMIREAHIGLGVMGKEGRQAVRCSDFAFARFRFLQRALLVHGHWYYVRVSTLVQYSFYKNVAFITPQLFYAIWNAFSTQSVYESLALTMYNITYTSLPVLIFGLLDRSLPQRLLLQRPHLYRLNARNAAMSWLAFMKWTLYGVWHSAVLYFGLMGACWDDTCGLPKGQTSDLYLFGTTLVSLSVLVTNCKLVLESHNITQLYFWSFVITGVGYVGLNLIYQGFLFDLFDNYGVYWTYYRLFESPALQLTTILLVVVCLLPDVLEKVYRSFGDERVRERRYKKKPRAVSLKSFEYVNDAFDHVEGPTSLWEVTKIPNPNPVAEPARERETGDEKNTMRETIQEDARENWRAINNGETIKEIVKEKGRATSSTRDTIQENVGGNAYRENNSSHPHYLDDSSLETWSSESVAI